MGFLDQIAETARQMVTGDNWYFKNEPYILEIRSSGLLLGNAYMVLPLGPENYRVSRIFRQSVTPTLGGLHAEERGLLWRMITVSGTFGLAPKFSTDTSLGPDPIVFAGSGASLSGPAWTRRMISNYFERYAEFKADPNVAADTVMIWHDTKTGDSWVVVPESVDVDRTVARRGQYPWMFQLKAIARSVTQRPVPPTASLSGLGKIKQTIAAVNKGLALVNAAVQEGSAILGEIRFFVATIDATLDKLDTIVVSATDFVNGVTATISVGRAFVTSTADTLEDALILMETAAGLPDSVRQNYQLAMDGLDAIAAQAAAFGTTYQEETAVIGKSELGAEREDRDTLESAETAGPPTSAALMTSSTLRSSDLDLVDAGALATGRPFANYTDFVDYAIESTDTLESIAAKFLGDGTLWYDLAVINGLNAPYISRSGIPNTVTVGDVISIPSLAALNQNAVVSGVGSEPGEDILGVDIRLIDTSQSEPGRPSVDIAINRGTFRDLQTIKGFANYAQALQLRVWTERGHMPLLPLYGLRRAIGIKSTAGFLAILRLNFEESIRQDSRTKTIGRFLFEVRADLIEVDMDVTPIGAGSVRTVSTALV